MYAHIVKNMVPHVKAALSLYLSLILLCVLPAQFPHHFL